MLRGRITALRTLAEATDGLAIVNSNDLSGGLRRVVADLSSYYLMGYYSSGKLDGKFHSISVRVKRPGVQVRARRGYLAATTAEVERTARNSGASVPVSAKDAEALAVESALRPLSSFTKEASLRLRAAAGWKANSQSVVWLVGELGSADAWRLGAETEVTLSKEGETLASQHLKVPPGVRHFRVMLSPAKPLAPGDYSVNVMTPRHVAARDHQRPRAVDRCRGPGRQRQPDLPEGPVHRTERSADGRSAVPAERADADRHSRGGSGGGCAGLGKTPRPQWQDDGGAAVGGVSGRSRRLALGDDTGAADAARGRGLHRRDHGGRGQDADALQDGSVGSLG